VPLVNLNAWDEDTIRNDLIGQKVIDLKTCFQNPDTYAYNEIVPLEGPKDLLGKYRTFGSVYLQAKFLKAESQDTDNFAPLKITLKDHLEKNRVKGKIIVNCVHAKYLLKESRVPDAMLRLIFPNKERLDTSYKSSNAFPEWKETRSSDIDLPRVEAGFLDIIVLDRGVFSNEEIGQLSIDIAPCFDKPNEWVINNVFPVKPPKAKESNARR
jgi:hypothetical protein